jgi:hypothetical protein
MNKTYLTGDVKAIDDGDPNGAFEVILSAPTLDRDGEVLDFRCFDPLPKHITFDIDHGLSTATTVGSGEPRYEDGVLKVSGTFSSIPRAQEVRTLVAEGHIRTTSVAFMAPQREVKDGVTHIVSAEILNGAFVPVPSNRESVVLAAKSHLEAVIDELDTTDGPIITIDGVTVTEAEARERFAQIVEPPSTEIPDAAPEDAAPAAIPPASSATAMAHALAAEAEVLLID